MASGLVALLDDVVAITKLAAASLDDVGAAAGKAGSKAAGVVVDDAAVTPRYVVGLTPDRELPIIAKIAAGTLRNKLLILLPIALLLSAFAPWAITPLLMLGGAFLAFEGAEKVVEAFEGGDGPDNAEDIPTDVNELEQRQVAGAIRTDLILSAEIMAITLSTVADAGIVTQAFVLALVGIAITIGVYGVVGFIVKMDDIGLHFARRRPPSVRAVGRGLVKAMPILMRWLSIIGTAAMIWVGGGILVHGAAELGLVAPEHLIQHASDAAAHAVPSVSTTLGWVVTALGSGLVGLVVGGVIAAALHAVHKVRG